MIFIKRKMGFLGLLVLMGIFLSACDQIASIKEYFQGSSKEPAAQAAKAVKPEKNTPVPQQKKTAAAPMKANTLARVGSWSITTEEFKERLDALKEVVPEYDINEPEARQLVLDELINQQIIVLGAEQSGLANQRDIDAAVDEFRRTLIVREVARQLTENITISDEEARAFYDENKEAMVGSAQWHVREIVAPTKEQANSILTELLNGADFAATAQLRSVGKTAAQGGDLGFITEEPFPQMGVALLSLEVGDISGAFKGPDGYYIVKLEEKKEGAPISFEEIKDDIIQSQTLLKQQQVILDHLNDLKSKTKVEINEQLL